MKTRIAVALLLLSTACTSIYQRRGTETGSLPTISVADLEGDSPEKRLRQLDWEARSIETFDRFELGVIEIGDDGLTNPAQVQQVMDMVDRRAHTPGRGTLIVTFIHGWHHGPGICDRDLACFRRVLDRLARMDHLSESVNVTGIYIGWRGESIAKPYFNTFTLFNRKNAATHIGRTGAKEVLLGLDEKYRLLKIEDPKKYVAMVTVGHSLGGAMVFNVMKGLATGDVPEVLDPSKKSFRVIRAETDRVEAAKRGEKAIRARLGDLVVLVNPAIEASQYAPFDNDLPDSEYPGFKNLPDKHFKYSEEQLPVLMTVASEADKAVGVAFPAARWVAALLHPRIAFSSARRLGMGHYLPHVTHTLDYTAPEVKDVPKVTCGCTKNFELADLNDEKQLDLYARGDQTFAGGAMKFQLVRDPAKWDPRSPFLVVRATKNVIDSHSDIYNPVFVSFLQKYIQAYVRESAAAHREATR